MSSVQRVSRHKEEMINALSFNADKKKKFVCISEKVVAELYKNFENDGRINLKSVKKFCQLFDCSSSEITDYMPMLTEI